MIFDQYSRYKACADLLHQAGFKPGASLLDVGSGPERLFGTFMPDALMTYVDPLIPNGVGDRCIAGDVFNIELDEKRFNFVSAVDVLEHVPPENRRAFLERFSSLGTDALILGFPTSDSSDAVETDKAIDAQYRAIFGRDYSWLEEHYRYGLPSLAETKAQLAQLGWHCQSIGHGHAPWLQELLAFVICVWDIPGLNDVVLTISEKFNRELYPYDFRPPYYRQFVIASRSPLPPFRAPENAGNSIDAETSFRALVDEAHRLYFAASIQHFALANDVVSERDTEIVRLNEKIQEVSSWATGLNASLAGREAEVARVSAKLSEVSSWAAGLETSLAARNAEIVQLNAKLDKTSTSVDQLGVTLAECQAWIARHNTVLGEQFASLAERNTEFVQLNAKLEKTSSSVDQLGAALAECQTCVARRNTALSSELSEKHVELMRMSDWADGMRRELERRNTSFIGKVTRAIIGAKKRVRRRIANSVFGDLVRHVRDRRRYREKRVTFDTVRESLAANGGQLIVTFPIITWDFRWQRPQHIVTRLRNKGHAILYVAMSMAALGRKIRSRNEAGALIAFNQLDSHVHQIWLHSAGKLNVYTDPIEGDDLHNLVSGLDAVITELKPTSVKYLLQFPGWWPIAEKLREKHGGKVVFDCMDDHAGFSTNTTQALQTEEHLIKSANLVITSSDVLEGKVRALNSKTIQVKNGTEFDHFHRPTPNGELDHLLGRPIIGYYGAISDWFDMDIVAQCAKAHPDWYFVLIGATFGADLSPVEKLSNVHFLGEKTYRDLPGYLAYFDVCTIPFKIIPLTLATNPVKFYEYLSAGKPIVSVALPELMPYDEDCYLAANAIEFDSLLVKALAEKDDPAKIMRRITLAKENSWDSRADVIVDAMKSL